VDIPIPDNPLKAVNSYFIKAKDRNLIIDTGMSRAVCLESMQAAIKTLDIDLERTDFFITHDHIDHIGLVGKLIAPMAKCYLNRTEAEFLSRDSWVKWGERIVVFAAQNGFFQEGIYQIKKIIADEQQRVVVRIKYTAIDDGDTVCCGNYTFRCIDTPGHSRGHTCLYDAGKKLLFSGDHILGDITPNISSRFNDTNPLREYMKSLEKVSQYDVELCLPGHRSPINNCKSRINELKQHHINRANEILQILESGNKNAYQVAALLRWDMDYETFEEFPVYPKWFAFGEALSHLQYLEGLGQVKRNSLPDSKIVYCKS
jgi:glyoxylase-like metal-dependent hydrolase (beta-lactamase superfamily II)